MNVSIHVSVKTFQAEVSTYVTTDELSRFQMQLQSLYKTLKGNAELITTEDQLMLKLNGDGKGHIGLKGEVADQPGTSNRLHFTLEFDQSQLKSSLDELEQVTQTFPIRKT